MTLPTNLPVEENNNPMTGAAMPGGGNRIFVGAKTPTENLYRNTIYLKLKTTPALAGLPVYLKSFDVDDATPTNFDVSNVIDANGAWGDDNYDDFLSTPKAGVFVSNNQQTITVTTDTNGEAQVEFKVGMQPGNNYRVAAAWRQFDLSRLQVNNPVQSVFFVGGNSDSIPGLNGTVSPMLTVWRKLHIEVDSMEAVATNGDEANFETGNVLFSQTNMPATGESRITTESDLRGLAQDNVYQNGRLEISGYAPFEIISNQFNVDINGSPFYYFFIPGTPGTNIEGQSFTLYDDDDRFLATIGLPPALPKDNESTNIIEGIRPVFFPAYIDVTNANAEGLNPNKTIAFKRNEEVATSFFGFPISSAFNAAKNLNDSSSFWTHTIVFGYQAESSDDLDPDTEAPLLGGSPEDFYTSTSSGFSVVLTEPIRDSTFLGIQPQFIIPENYFGWRSSYSNLLFGTVAHEIGHAPQRHGETADHDEDGLMQKGGDTITTSFWPETIKRFRHAQSWTN